MVRSLSVCKKTCPQHPLRMQCAGQCTCTVYLIEVVPSLNDTVYSSSGLTLSFCSIHYVLACFM